MTAASRSRFRPLRHLERALLVVGIVALGYCGWVWAESFLYQSFENRELDKILASAPAPSVNRTDGAAVRAIAPGSTIGRIEIPRLGVTAIVRAGSDSRTLQLAVGHIPGTAYPGEPGNVGLAGHRDTFFRQLRDIRPDDVIAMVTSEGRFTYRVQRTDIVQPSDVWVLDPTNEPSLTLVTCYPFSYIGTAPERFIVRAALEPAAMARASEPAGRTPGPAGIMDELNP
jgi:sortase A